MVVVVTATVVGGAVVGGAVVGGAIAGGSVVGDEVAGGIVVGDVDGGAVVVADGDVGTGAPAVSLAGDPSDEQAATTRLAAINKARILMIASHGR
jgi:hypothetical protein